MHLDTGDLVAAAVAAGAVVAGAREARRGTVRRAEIRSFVRLNAVTEAVRAPAWVLMQAGSIGGAVVGGSALGATLDRQLGRRVVVVGSLAWAGSKVVKPFARRGRPAAVLEAARVIGREQAGLGYPSGHAAVAVAIAGTLAPRLAPPWQGPLWAAAFAVGATRVYVGAHLPLDILGGYALGVATERTVHALRGPA